MNWLPGSGAKIPLQLARGCVVASIQIDLDDEVLATFRDELLEFVHVSGARAVILDLSGVEMMDGREFGALRDTMRMARFMGASTILSGLRPSVVSGLIDLAVDTEGIDAAATLDEAFEKILTGAPEEPDLAASEAEDPDEPPSDGIENPFR